MQITVGQRLASAVCGTEVIVVRTDGSAVDLACGGAPMTDVGADGAHGSGGPAGGVDDGTAIGKRYVDPDGRLELLCTKAGDGTLTLAGAPLSIKAAKSLPSSD